MRTATRLSLLRPAFFVAGALALAPALAQTTPPSPSAPQPTVPSAPPSSPVVEGIVGSNRPPLEVRKGAGKAVVSRHVHERMHVARRNLRAAPIERPALAGVELLGPAPLPPEPPHIVVPLPAYPLDSVATALFEPPPPITCRRAQRLPDVPDAHLAREVALQCAPDNP